MYMYMIVHDIKLTLCSLLYCPELQSDGVGCRGIGGQCVLRLQPVVELRQLRVVPLGRVVNSGAAQKKFRN